MDIGIREYWQNYLAGEWVDGARGRRFEVEDPATGRRLAEIARAEVEDADRAMGAAREAYRSRVLRDMTPPERGALLHRIADELEAAAEDVARAECLDNGKPISAARGEAASTARYFRYYAGMADKLEGRTIPLGPGYLDYTQLDPHGVSVHIVPWNFPLNIAGRSLAPALVTGNSVVMKSPRVSPLSMVELAAACDRAGVPPGCLSILCGAGSDVGQALLEHPDIDQVVFTGSVPTGQRVLHAAAARVIPAVMELGGKSAGIVYPDADLERVVESTITGAFTNAGQICSVCARLVVHREVYDRVAEGLVAAAEAMRIGPGIEDPDLQPLVSASQLEIVEGFCRRAEEEGATLLTGGRRPEGLPGHFFRPTVYGDVTPLQTIAREEVFGPVLALIPFDAPEEALEIANGTDFGLVSGVYTRDLSLAHWTAARLEAGQVFVNEWYAGGVETPFGGVKRSGFGREKGLEGLWNYVQTKNVAVRLEPPAPGGSR